MGGKGGEGMKVLYGHIMTRSCSMFWSQYDFRILWSYGDFPGPGMSDYDSEISWSYYDRVGPARSGYDFAAPGGMI
jgi:hypothetical protein